MLNLAGWCDIIFEGCLPQILRSPFLNTVAFVYTSFLQENHFFAWASIFLT